MSKNNLRAATSCAGRFLALVFVSTIAYSHSYKITPLGLIGNGDTSFADAINSAGQVAGYETGNSLPGGLGEAAVVWNSGTPTEVFNPGGLYPAGANGINDSGVVVGHWRGGWAFAGGTLHGLGSIFADADAINSAGQIVGSDANLPSGTLTVVAAFWSSPTVGNNPIFMDTLIGPGGESNALAINNSGQIVGSSVTASGPQHATFWKTDLATPLDLETLGGATSSATGINDAGVIVGYATTSGDAAMHATLWQATTATDLGTLGGTDSLANGINNAGEVVGWADTASSGQRATLWTNSGTALDLNTLITNPELLLHTLTEATAINSNGWIVADAALPNMSGAYQAYLLTPQVVVPNVVGQTQAAATAAITAAGLISGMVTTQPSKTVAPGSVIGQNPSAGADVAPGATVNLVVSSGIPVPNVVGQTQAAATAAITAAGLILGMVTTQPSKTVAPGSVISQNPSAGADVAPGATVNLVVSSGIPVPNVVGQTQAAATTAITGAGLTVGTVTQQQSNMVASGSVISQSPAAGSNVAGGSAVNLVVSSGSGSSGGSGGIDWLTLGALLSSLIVGLRRPRGVCDRLEWYGPGRIRTYDQGIHLPRSFRREWTISSPAHAKRAGGCGMLQPVIKGARALR
jgi:probable HAF family extracellular repeat protein